MTLTPREMLDRLLAQLDATEEHVPDTEPGSAPLAELWEGELEADLTEPVIRQIRFDQFVREVVSMGADIAMRMGSAAMEYTVGHDEPLLGQTDRADEDDNDADQSPEE